MSIKELDLYVWDIEHCFDIKHLSGLRARFIGMLRRNEISAGLYAGLNKDLRDRADWLKRR